MSDTPSRFVLVKGITLKQLVLLPRYMLNTVAGLSIYVVYFGVVFFGGRSVAGPAFTESLDGIIVGFFLFLLSQSAFAALASSVSREAQWGTLERLYMSPFGLGEVMIVKSFVRIALSLFWSSLFLLVMMLISGRWLTIDLLTVGPLLVLTALPAVGFGLAFGGLALIYKRIGNLLRAFRFVFVALVAAPVGQYPLLRFLPVTQGRVLTRRAMADGTRLWEFAPAELLSLVVPSVVYFVACYAAFKYTAGVARRRGVLGQY